MGCASSIRRHELEHPLYVNLNPGMMDNNVILSGRFDTLSYRGRWEWVSFVGPTNHGTFDAVRE